MVWEAFSHMHGIALDRPDRQPQAIDASFMIGHLHLRGLHIRHSLPQLLCRQLFLAYRAVCIIELEWSRHQAVMMGCEWLQWHIVRLVNRFMKFCGQTQLPGKSKHSRHALDDMEMRYRVTLDEFGTFIPFIFQSILRSHKFT